MKKNQKNRINKSLKSTVYVYTYYRYFTLFYIYKNIMLECIQITFPDRTALVHYILLGRVNIIVQFFRIVFYNIAV